MDDSPNGESPSEIHTLENDSEPSGQPKENSWVNPRMQRNILERKRKEKIKMFISQLKDMIPSDYLPSSRKPASNNTILETAVAYMRYLKNQNERILSGKGAEVQADEIKRLKKELAEVQRERDSYEQMVNKAAAVTPALIAQVSRKDKPNSTPLPNSSPLPAASKSESPNLPHLVNSQSSKIPGQGLIITQSGQAYYVNEQGIPIAQGVAPPQFIAETLISKVSVQSTSVTTETSPSSSSASVPLPSQGSNPTNLVNGLVAVPGHTGQLPSAIILPNGHVIPVVTSSNQPASKTDQLSLVTTATSSSIISTISSSGSSGDTKTTSSIPSNIMLLGQQPVLNNIVMNSAQPPGSVSQDSSSQIGRKIMPKPSTTSQIITRIAPQQFVGSLAPLSVTPCTTVPAGTTGTDLTSTKKKRTRKKNKDKSIDKSADSDILAEAAASLFSPKQKKDSGTNNGKEKATPTGSKERQPQESNQNDTHTPSPPALVSDNNSKAKKAKKRGSKSLNHPTHTDDDNHIAKKTKSAETKPATPAEAENSEKIASENPVSSCTAIEFDPNELDMVLDQVENISPNDQPDENKAPPTGDDKSHYQVLGEDDDIGPVFSTSKYSGEVVNESSPPAEDGRSSEINSIDQENLLPEPKLPSYITSDSYLIGNLTKTAEPVDHRRQGRSQASTSKLDVSEVYSSSDSHSIYKSKAHGHVTKVTNTNTGIDQPSVSSNPPISESNILNANVPKHTSDSVDNSTQHDKKGIVSTSGVMSPATIPTVQSNLPEKYINSISEQDVASPAIPSQIATNKPLNAIERGVESRNHSPNKKLTSWSPAKETEWTMNARSAGEQDRSQSNSTIEVSRKSIHQPAHSVPSQVLHKAMDLSVSDNQQYNYTQFNPGYADQRTPSESANIQQYWSEQHQYPPFKPSFHHLNSQSSQQEAENTAPNFIRKEISPRQSHISPAPSKASIERSCQSVSKSHAFSAESLLSKSSGTGNKSKGQLPSSHNIFTPDANRYLYDKDKNFMSSQPSSTPYNVNLFSSSSPTFSAFKSHGVAYTTSISSNPSFAFNLSKSVDSQPAYSRMNSNYPGPNHQLPFYLPQNTSQDVFSHQVMSTGRERISERETPHRSQAPELYRPVSEHLNNDVYVKDSNSSKLNTAVRQPIVQKPKKSKPENSPQQSTSPAVPYKIPHAPYLPTFHGSRHENNITSDLFGASNFHKSASQSFGLPFQSPSFHSIPPQSASNLTQHPQHSTGPQFNIDNIFRDSVSNDPFKFTGAPHPGTMYSPRPSHLYPNPMGINNIFGNGSSGFDICKPPSTGFTTGHAGLGFPSSFEFPSSTR